MYKKGIEIETIMEIMNLSKEEVEKIIKEKQIITYIKWGVEFFC